MTPKGPRFSHSYHSAQHHHRPQWEGGKGAEAGATGREPLMQKAIRGSGPASEMEASSGSREMRDPE